MPARADVPASEGTVLAEAPWGPAERRGFWPRRPFVRHASFELDSEKQGEDRSLSVHSLGKRHSTNANLLGTGAGTGSHGRVIVDVEAWADSVSTLDTELRVVLLQTDTGGQRIGIYSNLHSRFSGIKPQIAVYVNVRLPGAVGAFGELDVLLAEGSMTGSDLDLQADVFRVEARKGSILLKGSLPLSQCIHLIAEVGSVTVKEAAFTQDLVVESKTGSVFLEDVHASASVRLESEIGTVQAASIYTPFLKAASDVGSVHIRGQLVTGDAHVQSKVGSVFVHHLSPVNFASSYPDDKQGAKEARVGLLSRNGSVQATFHDRFTRHVKDPPASLAAVYTSKAESSMGSVRIVYNESFAGLVKASSNVGAVNYSWEHKGDRDWVFDDQRNGASHHCQGSVFFNANPLNTPEQKYLPAQTEVHAGTGSVNLLF